MCDECSRCKNPAWRVSLRLTAENEPICILCHGIRGWNDLKPLDAFPAYHSGLTPQLPERRVI